MIDRLGELETVSLRQWNWIVILAKMNTYCLGFQFRTQDWITFLMC